MIDTLITIAIIIIIFIVLLLSAAIKIMFEYQRIVIFRLGRLAGIKGPGLVLIIPIIDRIIKLDLRIRTNGYCRNFYTPRISPYIYN